MYMKKRIKVAEVVTRLEYGGVESVILNYINHMEKREEFEIHIITQDINSTGCIKLFEESGCIVHIITHKRKNILKNLIELNQILKREKFSIIHSHMNLTNFYVLVLGRIHGCKNRISHVHSVLKANSFLKKICYKIIFLINRVAANKYITCGIEAGNIYFGNKYMEKGKVELFPNAVDMEKFQYNEFLRSRIREKYGIKEDELVIGHIGRFTQVKNHIFLLQILKCMLERKVKVRLMLVGGGELLEEIKEEARKLGVFNDIIFVGNTNKTFEYYQAMDVFVLPSFYEGIPVVAVEAQCSALPCILSDNIDKSCKILEDVQFLPLDTPIEEWIKHILEYRMHSRSREVKKQIREAGYDILTEANLLAKFYKECVEKNRGRKNV